MEKNKQKHYYNVVVNSIIPITFKYKVLAEDEKEAVELVKKNKITPYHISKPIVNWNKTKSILVYLYGTINLLFSERK